jgi:hypothetical protein
VITPLDAHTVWYTRVAHSLPRVAEFLTALLAAVALAGFVRTVYRRSLGRRRDKYSRLRRLGTYAQLTFFSSVLGEPPAQRRRVFGQRTTFDENGQRVVGPRIFVEALWVDPAFYVQAIADEDETIHAYSVTARTKRFRPAFRPPGATAIPLTGIRRLLLRREYRIKPNREIVLGKTRFADLDNPLNASSWVGAHNAHYFETHYFGNPGYYQHFIYSVNDAGAWTWQAPFNAMAPDLRWGFNDASYDVHFALAEAIAASEAAETATEAPGAAEPDPASYQDPDLPPDLTAFRRAARINTYTVVSPDLFLDDYPGAEGRIDTYPVIFGVNSGRARTLGSE